MTWPTTFGLLVREEDRESPLLSHREREILALAVTGLTNRQIAARLTQSTARTHRSWAFGRLGVHSRGKAVGLANVGAVPDAAPAPRDDVVLACARSQLSP
jgi:DNA-binding CsgD family transcriptional regulator